MAAVTMEWQRMRRGVYNVQGGCARCIGRNKRKMLMQTPKP